jgi:hypothetical protein
MMTLKRLVKLMVPPIVVILVILVALMGSSSCCVVPPGQPGLDPAAEICCGFIPEEGTATNYGISPSLENTQQFSDWCNSMELSDAKPAVRDQALDSLVVPCSQAYRVMSKSI